jgi:hypothetical protein
MQNAAGLRAAAQSRIRWELLANLIRKDLKVKYQSSALGFVWSLVHPLLYLAVFTVVFTVFLRFGMPNFAVHFMTGMLCWNFFLMATSSATGSVVGAGSLVKKVPFPRVILPLASVGFAGVQVLLQFGVFFGFLELFGGGPLVTDQQLFLFYFIERCDPVVGWCDTAEEGSGLIPPGDLIVRGRKTVLRTNTSIDANATFERFVGSGGAINLQWMRTSAVVTSSRVQSRTRIKGVLLDHSRFHSTRSSALTQGSLLGLKLDRGNSGGDVGTIHSGVITVAKSPLEP